MVVEELETLLKETGENHHQAFIETDGNDPEWPIWYANYLYTRLNKLLNAELTKSETIHLLLSIEKQRTSEGSDANWPEYYAKQMLRIYD